MARSLRAKARFHKGVTYAFRTAMRKVGVSFDEEQAQFALAGMPVLTHEGEEFIDEVRSSVIDNRHHLMRGWEEANPRRNPYPPPFPERVLTLARRVVQSVSPDNEISPDGLVDLLRIEAICRAELRSDPFGPPDDVDPLQ